MYDGGGGECLLWYCYGMLTKLICACPSKHCMLGRLSLSGEVVLIKLILSV